MAGSGAHSREAREVVATQSWHSLELVGGTNPEAPHFSASLCT